MLTSDQIRSFKDNGYYIATREGYDYLRDFTYPADLLDLSERHGVVLV